jgi:hypothetical protein
MKTKEQICGKVERDQVLNLSELAVASGYDRSRLARMSLPLQGGKISLADFKRILHRRQDQSEDLSMAPLKPAERGSDRCVAGPFNGESNGLADRLFYQAGNS